MKVSSPLIAALFLVIACSPGSADEVDWCDTAETWRDAVQEFEAVTNRADRSTPAGRDEMHSAFAAIANITLPVVRDGEPGGELLASMIRFTDNAELWLSSGSTFFGYANAGVSGEPARVAYESYEAQRLSLNAAFRDANSHLVSSCGTEPIVLYSGAVPTATP